MLFTKKLFKFALHGHLSVYRHIQLLSAHFLGFPGNLSVAIKDRMLLISYGR